MKYIIATSIVSIMLLLSSCSGGAVVTPGPSNLLSLSLITWDLPGDIVLDLKGATNQTALTVTFYIFGSNDDLPEGMVPLGHQRLTEQAFGPLAQGEELLDVDLSPWDAYTHIFIYNLGTHTGGTIKLKPGKRYEFKADTASY